MFTRDAAAGIFLHDAALVHVCLPIGYSEWEKDDIAGQCGSPGILAGEHFGEHIKVGLSVRMQRY